MSSRSTGARSLRPHRTSLRVRAVFLGGLLGLLVLLLPGRTFAHRLNLITSDIDWRPEGQSLDISHRFHLDDALQLLATLNAADGVLDLEASARLMNYVEANFSVGTRGGVLALEPYGAHISGNTLFVYQRVELAELPAALEIKNQLMQDLTPEIRNQVNWRVGGVVRSHQGHRDAPVAWLVLAP